MDFLLLEISHEIDKTNKKDIQTQSIQNETKNYISKSLLSDIHVGLANKS